ncbi:unnamed protein product, partial [Polarella glacialis]
MASFTRANSMHSSNVATLRDMFGCQATVGKGQVADFTSDVGRKKFGFSHEDIDDSAAFYEGQFKLYLRSGEGTLHNTETGSKYVGQFHNDKYHGQGDQIWPDGS